MPDLHQRRADRYATACSRLVDDLARIEDALVRRDPYADLIDLVVAIRKEHDARTSEDRT